MSHDRNTVLQPGQQSETLSQKKKKLTSNVTVQYMEGGGLCDTIRLDEDGAPSMELVAF